MRRSRGLWRTLEAAAVRSCALAAAPRLMGGRALRAPRGALGAVDFARTEECVEQFVDHASGGMIEPAARREVVEEALDCATRKTLRPTALDVRSCASAQASAVDVEREAIEDALRRTGDNVAAAARLLAVPKSSLHETIKRKKIRMTLEPGPVQASSARARAGEARDAAKRLLITDALQRSGGNIRAAAALLKWPKSTVHEQMKRLQIYAEKTEEQKDREREARAKNLRKSRLGDVRIAHTELAPYGLAGAEACTPVAPGKQIQVCIKRPAKPGAALRMPTDACKVLRSAENADRESFYALHLDHQNRVLGVEEIARGGLAEVAVHPREVFKSALLTNAASLIIAHNHPSGVPTPSSQDWDVTRRLIDAGKVVGVPIRDHVIVGAEGCVSLREVRPSAGFEGVRRRSMRRGRHGRR